MDTFVIQPLEQRVVYYYDVIGGYALDELKSNLEFDTERYFNTSNTLKDFLLDIRYMEIPARGPWENRTLEETGKWILIEGDTSDGWDDVWKDAMERKDEWKTLTEIIEIL